MKSTLKVGSAGSLKTEVGPGNVITLGGDRKAAVFSTPSMINLMEFAAREALRPHLDEGEESVGIDVQVQHTAATPPKNEVTAQAVVVAIEKNVVSFDIVARDAWGEIGTGTHRRAIIRTEKFAQRLADTKPTEKRSSSSIPSLNTLLCRVKDNTLVVTLNRPRKRNAMNCQMTSELSELLDWLENSGSEIRSVIVHGAEESFCAGDDVGELPEDARECRDLSLFRGETYMRITELPQIFIAAIDGLALGGGLVMAAACDFRIATHRAQLGLPEVSLGWPPNYGMGIVQSIIGRGPALSMALTGRPLNARQALNIGLVSQLCSPSRLLPDCWQLATQFTQPSGRALSEVKSLLSPRRKWSEHAASEAFVACLETDQAKASRARFKSK